MKGIGAVGLLAAALAPPELAGLLRAVELEHERAIVKAGQKEVIAVLAWSRNGHAGAQLAVFARGKWKGPMDGAGLGIEGVDGLRVPDNELAFAGDLDHRWGRIAWLTGRQGTPHFLTGHLVDGNRHTSFTAYQAYEMVAIQERMAGKPPLRHFHLVILGQVFGRQDLTAFGLHSQHCPHAAPAVAPAAANTRAGTL